MIVENRKTGIVYEISEKEWKSLITKGMKNAYKVLSKEDAKDKKKIAIPKQIIEFQDNPDKLRLSKSDVGIPKTK